MNNQEEELMYSTEETLTDIILELYQRGIESEIVFIITVAMEYEEQAKMYLQWLRKNPDEMDSSRLVEKIAFLKIQLVGHQ